MKQIEVQILQQSYLLSCPEGHESRLLEAVERVDTAMTRIRDAGKVRARERIAVLAALNLAFDIADREAADLAAAHMHPATLPHPSEPASQPFNAGADALRLQTLVQRLDDALGEDGRLL
ncbi:cell division protein ZapA [Acidovorax sp. JHL-9]|uniref:cell division protein ZapA n=1 Tax=Acidovorax sp. JHL-9 TaxID=1276756 RepID=UPI00041977BE|nr:cell division protein ZapA [Acidovorax sp. JHL-9]